MTELIYFYSIPHIGIGAGAGSFREINTPHIKSYIDNPGLSRVLLNGNVLQDFQEIVHNLLLFPEGFSIPYFNRRFSCDIEKLLKNPKFNIPGFNRRSKDLQEQGILEQRSNYIRIAPEARFIKTWGFYASTI